MKSTYTKHLFLKDFDKENGSWINILTRVKVHNGNLFVQSAIVMSHKTVTSNFALGKVI